MKAFTNANPKDLADAVALSRQAQAANRTAVFAGGGSDLMGLVKERIVQPDLVINLKGLKEMRGLDQISTMNGSSATVGGQVTLDTLASHEMIRRNYAALAEAAGTVATPQIRNVGTLAGNICQRPWCWYYRNGFKCYKAGGNTCYSVAGENQFHAIFGGGPSFIVHPSDTAPALVALEATFRIVGPNGERFTPAADFFVLPRANAQQENVLAPNEVLAGVTLPRPNPRSRSTYFKVLDREAWTHAVVSAAVVLEMDGAVCRSARVVMGGVAPIPWRLPDVERALAGQRITPELAARAGEIAIQNASPMAKNAYKVPLTKGVIERTVAELAARA